MSEETTELVATSEVDKQGVVLAADFGDEGAGFENQTADDVAIPFISVLQDGNPQTKKKSDAYVPGAEPGMLFNTVTQELIDGDEGLLFQVCHVDHCVLEWTPRDEGGGFVARHDPDSQYVKEAYEANGGKFGKVKTVSGTELQEVYSLWGTIPRENDTPTFAIFSCASVKIKAYKAWNTLVSQFTVFNPRTKRKQRPDRFSHLIRVKSIFKTSSKGDHFSIVIEPAVKVNGSPSIGASLQTPDSDNYKTAKAFRELVITGVAQANFDQSSDAQGNGEEAPF